MALRQLPGVRVPHTKNTAGSAPVRAPLPAKVVLPMRQHIGAPCTPAVKVGDLVKVGQPVGEAAAPLCAPVHATVSGKVTAVDPAPMPDGTSCLAVTIQSDGEQTRWEGLSPPVVTDAESFLAAVRASGVVGLGGAGFPTGVKLAFPASASVDTLVINGAECEPVITPDTHTLLLHSEAILHAAGAIRRYLGLSRAVLCVKENRADLAELFEKQTEGDTGFSVHRLREMYPQGAENVLIYESTGRWVEKGALPYTVGCLVLNVETLGAIGDYLLTGTPLIEKIITVDGSAVNTPQNILVPIGTSVHDAVEAAGGCKTEPAKIIIGGPMMGIAVKSDEVPLIKTANAVLCLDEKDARPPREGACIRCGRCARACPYGLTPYLIDRAYALGNIAELEKLSADKCMECGCCSFACPAKRGLSATFRLARQLLRETRTGGGKGAN